MKVGDTVKYELNKKGTGPRIEWHLGEPAVDHDGNGYYAFGKVKKIDCDPFGTPVRAEVWRHSDTGCPRLHLTWWPPDGGGILHPVSKIRFVDKNGYTITEPVE